MNLAEHATIKTVQNALAQYARIMTDQGIDNAVRDARILMAAALSIAPDRVTLHAQDAISSDALAQFERLCKARCARVPVSRILGKRLFYGRTFLISSDVLDPRPETEILIENALGEPFERVLDLGTGSGCIALTLLCEANDGQAVATDISTEALKMTKTNAKNLGVEDRIQCVQSDWFHAVTGKFDLIVSNPPYIHPDEMDELAPEVARHDPAIALTDANDGLKAYREIAARASAYLTQHGRLLVEIGPTQGFVVKELFANAGLENINVHTDFDGRDRVVSATASLSKLEHEKHIKAQI